MSTLFATTLLGLLALQGGAPEPATSPVPEHPVERPAPVQLAPVSITHTCDRFDEGEMRARLLDPNLVDREHAYTELLKLGANHPAIYATIAAWAEDKAALELAWTARLALRELRQQVRRQVGSSQALRVNVRDSRPWQEDYHRQVLLQLGLDPEQYRVSGLMRMSPQEAAQLGIEFPRTAQTGVGLDSTSTRSSAYAEQPLGVVCNEQLRDRVVLTRIVPGTIADSIGLAAGDQLLSVGGMRLTGPIDLTDAMHRWNSRAVSSGEMLEVIATDGRTGKDKHLYWNPAPASNQ